MTMNTAQVIRHTRRSTIAIIGLLLCLFTTLEATGGDGAPRKGKDIYNQWCAPCHGQVGRGDGYTAFDPPPADLTASATQAKSDEELLHTIRNGHPNTAMGTWQYVLSEEEIQAVLGYLRTLAQRTSPSN